MTRATSMLLLVGLCLVASAPAAPAPAIDRHTTFAPCTDFPHAAVERFSTVLSFRTVSDASKPYSLSDAGQFTALLAYLEHAYGEVWARLKVERVGLGGYSLLFTWAGSQPALKPALFISHLDVVPVSPGTEDDWVHTPFSGDVADGYIWGRGALDVKNGVVGLLEAASALLAEGYSPRRTLMFAFGQDEEVGGDAGAAQIAGLLAQRGVELEFIWDEGGCIYSTGVRPFTSRPVALVATAEKLYQSVSVTLHSSGGHSSMPPIDASSIAARLGRLLTSLVSSPPAPRLVSPSSDFVAGLLELAPGWLSSLRILAKLAPRQVNALLAYLLASADNQAAALVRDTAAVTSLAAGVADNMLPQTCNVSINFRLLPGTPRNATIQHVLRWLGPDAHANISLVDAASAPSRVTDHKGLAFRLAQAAIQRTWRFADGSGELLPVLPFLMPGGTDSKWYQNLTTSIVRFSPMSLAPDQLSLVHGTNERILVEDFKRLLCTYATGLRLAGDGGDVGDAASQPGTTAEPQQEQGAQAPTQQGVAEA